MKCASGSMDRASDSGSEGWGFESLLAYQRRIIRTCSQWEMGSDYLFSWANLKKRSPKTGVVKQAESKLKEPRKRSGFR